MTKEELKQLIDKVKHKTATEQEKLAVLKEMNLSMEELNKLLEHLLSSMKNEA
ncbi:hypothetical protein M1513_01325 [Patescibacteria group bacterium]|nr:hypothetical protein [Patescibacteria group bacterium]MCL5733058.1 hypothetical protein [Patescibacteria group bacterium]